MSKLGWYIKRLRVMSPVEVLWRLLERFRLYLLFIKWKSQKEWNQYQVLDAKKFGFLSSDQQMLPALKWASLIDVFDEISMLNGECMALGYSWKWIQGANSWHKAPDTGNMWPKAFFGSISYRHGNPYGDARVVWEPSRLQHLLDLALFAESLQGEKQDKAIALIEDELISWHKDNPPLTGIHYTSAMECAIRIISVCYIYDILRTRFTRRRQIEQIVASLVISHADLIMHRLSLHSSAGNHTVAETAGLVFAGILFSEFQNAETWKSRGLDLFASEINRQILDDGGGIEQAFWYLLFITDLAGLVTKLLGEYKVKGFDSIAQAFNRGCGFLSKFADGPEELPAIGDSDDGYALSRYLRISFGAMSRSDRIYLFPDSGYTLINSRSVDDFKLVFDHGALGMPPSYGHGQADALSLILDCGKNKILVDSGTFTYTGDEVWRKYFRSTHAHNTVLINDFDQARQESAFLWSNPYLSKLHKIEELSDGVLLILGFHDGYKSFGVRHWRGLVVFPEGAVVIWDCLEGNAKVECELNWHLGQKCQKVDGYYKLVTDTEVFNIDIVDCEITIYDGSIKPVSGWRSIRYGAKETINTLNVKKSDYLPIEFVTRIYKSKVLVEDSIMNSRIDILRGWCRDS